MANTLTFTSPIIETNMTKAKILRVLAIDEDNNIIAFEVQLNGPGGVLYPAVFVMTLTNASGCDALVANLTPTTITDTVLQVRLSPASTPTAFTTALTAYRSAGGDKRGNLLTALLGITGTVQGGPLNGQTVPILPVGVVS